MNTPRPDYIDNETNELTQPSRIIHPWGIITTGTDYPQLNVPELLRAMADMQLRKRRADRAMLDALVDIINRSPFTTQQWAVLLDLPLQLLVDICHRKVEMKQLFYDRVREFFEPFRGRNPSWDEIRDRWTPKPVPTS